MTFLSTDLYTTSGDAKVLKTWTQFVQKYDSSSFYNWEQDNIPLYDLEDRTNYLWEHAGYPASSCPGLAFAVSSLAPAADLTCNPNLFSTVSAAIAGLPRVLRFPVLIEVASFGDLGKLELNNITCEDGGSLEIVNRNFSKLYSASSIVATTTSNRGVGVAATVSSLDASNTLYHASALSLGGGAARDGVILSAIDNTSSLNIDNRVIWQSAPFTVTTPPAGASVKLRTNRLVCNPTSRTNLISGAKDEFAVSALYEAGTNDVTMPRFDTSTYNQGTAGSLFRQDSAVGAAAVGMIYGNYLRKIKVENCVGPIFIRNFVVDGTTADTATQAVQETEIGIEVNNSNIILENCAAERCSDAGIQFNNSKVVISRGLVGYRNYKMDGAASRMASSVGAGLRLVNSEVTLSGHTDPQTTKGVDMLLHFAYNDVGIELINSKLKGGITRPSGGNAQSPTYLQASYNGRSTGNFALAASLASSVPFGAGITLENSVLDIDGRLDIWNNSRGIVAENSKLFIDECTLEFNMHEGLDATNSFIQYNKNKFDIIGNGDAIAADTTYNVNQFHASGNGQHLVLDHSKFLPADTSTMPTNMARSFFSCHHGVDDPAIAASSNSLPAIELRNGSEAELVHALIMTTNATTGPFRCKEAVFGAALAVTNGSTARMKGSEGGATIIFGPDTFAVQRRAAGVYVENGSEVSFAGPTAIARFGIGVLAEDHATVSFGPHKDRFGGIEGTKWELGKTANHTSVELHATRACLVANKNSTINMNDLGHYRSTWGNADVINVDYHASGGDSTFDVSSWTRGGSMQFYPNPDDSDANTTNDSRQQAAIGGTATNAVSVANRVFGTTTAAWTAPIATWSKNSSVWNTWMVGNPHTGDLAPVTWGGVCLQAANNSTVNVKNVHFPTGWENASSVIYDASSDCAQTRLWLITDQSHLNCAYTSVSGHYPTSAVYNGPGTAWTSGTADEGHGICSGAPDLHPTGPLSLLDYFGGSGEGGVGTKGFITPPLQDGVSGVYTGKRADANPITLGTPSAGAWPGQIRNKGPFRLYFSVHPVAKHLLVSPSGCVVGLTSAPTVSVTLPTDLSSAWVSAGVYGPPTQIFAQGYNLSSNVSAAPAASDLYPDVMDFTPVSAMDTSGTFRWWDCNEVVDDAYMRVMLDESAANTFANAKNASLGIGNKPRLVSIYKSTNAAGGEDFDTDAIGYSPSSTMQGGVGFRSTNIIDLKRGITE